MKNKTIVVAAVLAMLNGCSAYKVITQPGPADLTGIGVGTPRQEIIGRLGACPRIETKNYSTRIPFHPIFMQNPEKLQLIFINKQYKQYVIV